MKNSIHNVTFYRELLELFRKHPGYFKAPPYNTMNITHLPRGETVFIELKGKQYHSMLEEVNSDCEISDDIILRIIIRIYLYEARNGPRLIINKKDNSINYLEKTFQIIVKEMYRIFEIDTLNINKGVCKNMVEDMLEYRNSFDRKTYPNLTLGHLIRTYII